MLADKLLREAMAFTHPHLKIIEQTMEEHTMEMRVDPPAATPAMHWMWLQITTCSPACPVRNVIPPHSIFCFSICFVEGGGAAVQREISFSRWMTANKVK